VSGVVGHQETRWVTHRLLAHRMRRRGLSVQAIADHLRVNKRSVNRYLALPCPDADTGARGVALGSFYLQGACGGFPDLDWLSRSPRRQAEAKAVCAHCPVLGQCRRFGLTTGLEESGIWGGLTKAERQREVHGEPGPRGGRRSRRSAGAQGAA
jgi:WhiB family transcriptional regulator, redox-sensing transcriptional regulator